MLSPEGEEFQFRSSGIHERRRRADIPQDGVEDSVIPGCTKKSGPVLAVASLSGIKSNPHFTQKFQRMNSYVDAFKDWFPEKIGRKAAVPKLVLLAARPSTEMKVVSIA